MASTLLLNAPATGSLSRS